MSLVLLLLLGSGAPSQGALAGLLETLAAAERGKDTLGSCAYSERTVIEELDGEGRVVGTVVREYAVVLGRERQRRVLTSERFEGEPSSAFRKRPDDEREEDARQRLAFHPDERARFSFELAQGAPGTLALRFAPETPDRHRLRGTALLDADSKRVRVVEGEPTRLPRFVDRLKLRYEFAATPCGDLPVRVRSEGEGGVLFVKKRFRTTTELSGHRVGR
ncbi:MAG: hypothetical protein ACK4N5_11135 [Myxococcales bacterium]